MVVLSFLIAFIGSCLTSLTYASCCSSSSVAGKWHYKRQNLVFDMVIFQDGSAEILSHAFHNHATSTYKNSRAHAIHEIRIYKNYASVWVVGVKFGLLNTHAIYNFIDVWRGVERDWEDPLVRFFIMEPASLPYFLKAVNDLDSVETEMLEDMAKRFNYPGLLEQYRKIRLPYHTNQYQAPIRPVEGIQLPFPGVLLP
jgi:hypothetical protein